MDRDIRLLYRQLEAIGWWDNALFKAYTDKLKEVGHTEALLGAYETKLRKAGWDKEAFVGYSRMINQKREAEDPEGRLGVALCSCEQSGPGCADSHVYNPKYGPAPKSPSPNQPEPPPNSEQPNATDATWPEFFTKNPGHCLNLVDPKVRVDYVSMCNDCAVRLDSGWHLEGCGCTKCAPPQATRQAEPDPEEEYELKNGEWVQMEADPEEEGWHEDWESDEFEDEGD